MSRLSLKSRLLVIAMLACTRGHAENPIQGPSEYQVKAAFLYNFVKFVEWPPQAQNESEGIVLCVFGKDPFRGALDQVADGKSVNGRALAIRRINDLAAARSCHVLFMTASEANRAGEIANAIRSSGVLTVTESGRLAEEGGIIHFVMEGQRVRFQIDTRAAAQAGLKISSKLLQLAVAAPDQRVKR